VPGDAADGFHVATQKALLAAVARRRRCRSRSSDAAWVPSWRSNSRALEITVDTGMPTGYSVQRPREEKSVLRVGYARVLAAARSDKRCLVQRLKQKPK
jgi:hypothetical protein